MSMYFNKALLSHPKDIHHLASHQWSPTKKLTFTALMAVIAGIFQSAGGMLPGIGYLFSPLATAPILLGMLISFRSGVLTYLLTICLLLFIQPSELVIFPFTTGLLGLSLGWTFCRFHRPLAILFTNGFILWIGICIPLYGLYFPVLGPTISSSFHIKGLMILFGFSLLYSWFWLAFGMFLLRKIKRFLLFSK